MDISAWLRGLDLERYEQAFRENAINEAMTAEDLRDLGVTAVGHRRILLGALNLLTTLRNILSRPTAPVAKLRKPNAASSRSCSRRLNRTRGTGNPNHEAVASEAALLPFLQLGSTKEMH
jgi:hypothetical protein